MKWISVKDDLPNVVEDYFVREIDTESGGWKRYHVFWNGEYFLLMGSRLENENLQWLPNEQNPERSVATGDAKSYEAGQIKEIIAQYFGYKSFSEMDTSDQRMAEKVMELLNKEI